jgi:uncharacterized protein (TIGR02996 family)
VKPVARDLELLQTIIQNPDDDTPRLIYADWLEDNGNQPRAEFIRAQCECARLFRAGKEIRQALDMRAKYADLLRKHEKEWVGEFPNKAQSWSFARGFIEYVAVEAGNFLKYADDIFANTPIRRLYISNVGRLLRQIADCPHLARLSQLHLSQLGQPDMTPLVLCPYLTNIDQLEIWDNIAPPADIRALRHRFGERVRF